LTLAPVVCIIAAIGLNEVLEKAGSSIRESMIYVSWDVTDMKEKESVSNVKSGEKKKKDKIVKKETPETNYRSKLLPLIPAVGVIMIVLSVLQH